MFHSGGSTGPPCGRVTTVAQAVISSRSRVGRHRPCRDPLAAAGPGRPRPADLSIA